jgi:hypothetical protein
MTNGGLHRKVVGISLATTKSNATFKPSTDWIARSSKDKDRKPIL